jgi:hypothetical protein
MCRVSLLRCGATPAFLKRRTNYCTKRTGRAAPTAGTERTAEHRWLSAVTFLLGARSPRAVASELLCSSSPVLARMSPHTVRIARFCTRDNSAQNLAGTSTRPRSQSLYAGPLAKIAHRTQSERFTRLHKTSSADRLYARPPSSRHDRDRANRRSQQYDSTRLRYGRRCSLRGDYRAID